MPEQTVENQIAKGQKTGQEEKEIMPQQTVENQMAKGQKTGQEEKEKQCPSRLQKN